MGQAIFQVDVKVEEILASKDCRVIDCLLLTNLLRVSYIPSLSMSLQVFYFFVHHSSSFLVWPRRGTNTFFVLCFGILPGRPVILFKREGELRSVSLLFVVPRGLDEAFL